jgi:SnoaL-like domain
MEAPMTAFVQDDGIRRGRSPEEIIQMYVAAWNAHDGAATVRQLAPGGTYVDPMLPGPIGGDDLARYVESLADAFPDVAFEPRTSSFVVIVPCCSGG